MNCETKNLPCKEKILSKLMEHDGYVYIDSTDIAELFGKHHNPLFLEQIDSHHKNFLDMYGHTYEFLMMCSPKGYTNNKGEIELCYDIQVDFFKYMTKRWKNQDLVQHIIDVMEEKIRLISLRPENLSPFSKRKVEDVLKDNTHHINRELNKQKILSKLEIEGERIFFNSVDIAELFGKNHNDLVTEIASMKEVYLRSHADTYENIVQCQPRGYTDSRGERKLCYDMQLDFFKYLTRFWNNQDLRNLVIDVIENALDHFHALLKTGSGSKEIIIEVKGNLSFLKEFGVDNLMECFSIDIGEALKNYLEESRNKEMRKKIDILEPCIDTR